MSPYKLDLAKVTLTLKEPFGISRGTKKQVENVFVRLKGDGYEGLGEAAPNTRYGEDAQKVVGYIEGLPDDIWDKIATEDQLVAELDEYEKGQPAPVRSARAALEMAWLDWHSSKAGVPLWQVWGFHSPVGIQTSYTIGLDKIEVMQQKVKDAAEYPILKVKLGTDRDRSIIRGIREVTNKPIRVDANEGWKTLEEAVDMLGFLNTQNIELVEQPLPAGMYEEMKELKKSSPLPLAADESFLGDESLHAIHEAFDIINIKLMKIGSMVKARKVIEEARDLGLQIMIGCMIESSVANTAAAVLALDADFADLDGHLLIKDDPARGLLLDDQKYCKVVGRPGLGLKLESAHIFSATP